MLEPGFVAGSVKQKYHNVHEAYTACHVPHICGFEQFIKRQDLSRDFAHPGKCSTQGGA